MIASIIAWIILGLIAGIIAKVIMPGTDPGGNIVTVLIGIAGAFVGGWVGNLLHFMPSSDPGSWLPGIGSIITATVGALLLLIIYRLVKRAS